MVDVGKDYKNYIKILSVFENNPEEIVVLYEVLLNSINFFAEVRDLDKEMFLKIVANSFNKIVKDTLGQ